jgi:hypothetical protein
VSTTHAQIPAGWFHCQCTTDPFNLTAEFLDLFGGPGKGGQWHAGLAYYHGKPGKHLERASDLVACARSCCSPFGERARAYRQTTLFKDSVGERFNHSGKLFGISDTNPQSKQQHSK